MNNLIKKDFFSEDGLFSLTVALENREILFDAEKVSRCLGIIKTEIRKGVYIPESAVYKLAFKASNEVAEKFQDWLAIDVIPNIIKYGSYSVEVIKQQNIINAMKTELTGIVDRIVENKVAEIEEKCSEYIRPLSKRKQDICNYIKKRLGIEKVDKEYELVKDRVLLVLGEDKWEDIPVDVLRESMDIIDESIQVIKSDRVVNQISIFELACSK